MLLCSRLCPALLARFHMLLLIAAWPLAAEGAEALAHNGPCAGAGASPVQRMMSDVSAIWSQMQAVFTLLVSAQPGCIGFGCQLRTLAQAVITIMTIMQHMPRAGPFTWEIVSGNVDLHDGACWSVFLGDGPA